ncbi:hypothetical protein LPJ61_004871, partial [Coemansia biformis]
MDSSPPTDIIVLFKASASAAEKEGVMDTIKKSGGHIKNTSDLINGLFARLPKSNSGLADLKTQHPAIDDVEIE